MNKNFITKPSYIENPPKQPVTRKNEKTSYQKFETRCHNCFERVVSDDLALNIDGVMSLDHLEDLELNCDCGVTTYIEIKKYNP